MPLRGTAHFSSDQNVRHAHFSYNNLHPLPPSQVKSNGEMALWKKAWVTKPDDLSLNSRTNVKERMDSYKLSSDLLMCTYSHKYTVNKLIETP